MASCALMLKIKAAFSGQIWLLRRKLDVGRLLTVGEGASDGEEGMQGGDLFEISVNGLLVWC